MLIPTRWPADEDGLADLAEMVHRVWVPWKAGSMMRTIRDLVAAHPTGPPPDLTRFLRAAVERTSGTGVANAVMAIDTLYLWADLPLPSQSASVRAVVSDLLLHRVSPPAT